jgi:hypothetical protein
VTEPLTGADFVAVSRLSARGRDGAWIVVAEAGDTCERVPPESLGALLASGHIRLAAEKEA